MICLVTDCRRVSAGPDATARLVELVASAARAGVDLIQVRERDLDTRSLLALVRQCLDAAQGTGARVLVNDRADVALAAGAQGVHLRSDSISAAKVRTLLPDGAIVGRSIHSAEEAEAAAREGATDYLIFGTLFETASKSPYPRLATLDELTEVCRAAAGLPVLAIGGMNIDRAALVRRAGAAGVAGIGLFIPPDATREPDRHLHDLVVGVRRSFDTFQAVS